MDATAAALLVVAGAAAGFLSGALAIGDGIVMVPVLLIVLRGAGVSSLVSTQVAMGTSLAATAAASLVLAWSARKRDQVIGRDALVVGLSGAVAALAAVAIACSLEGPSLRKVFGVLLLIAAVRLFAGKKKSAAAEQSGAFPKLALAGLCGGLTAGLTGSGGTVVAAPLLHRYVLLPLRKAVGTAHAAAAACAAAGALAFVLWGWTSEFLPAGMHGFVDWPSAAALAVGAVPGAVMGDRFGATADKTPVRATYAVILLVVMLRMFFA